MTTDRRTPDFKTWLYRGLAGFGISLILFMLPLGAWMARGWAETWLSGIALQNGMIISDIKEIKENTKDLSIIRFKTDTMWQASNIAKQTPLPHAFTPLP